VRAADGVVSFAKTGKVPNLDFESGRTTFDLGVIVKDKAGAQDPPSNMPPARVIVRVLDANDAPTLDRAPPCGDLSEEGTKCIRWTENQRGEVDLREYMSDQDGPGNPTSKHPEWACCDDTTPFAVAVDHAKAKYKNNACKGSYGINIENKWKLVVAAGKLNFEADRDGCDVAITVTDKSGAFNVYSVHITIIDENDKPTNLRLAAPGSCTVDETALPLVPTYTFPYKLTPTGCRFEADDEEKEDLLFSFANALPSRYVQGEKGDTVGTGVWSSLNYFEIEDNTLKVINPLSYEKTHAVTFKVKVDDVNLGGGVNPTTATILVTINDINEPPHFTDQTETGNYYSVPENWAGPIRVHDKANPLQVRTIVAEDPDTDASTEHVLWKTLKYSIPADHENSDKFAIDEDSGVVSTKSGSQASMPGLDFEPVRNDPGFSLKLVVQDQAAAQKLSDEIDITVVLLDKVRMQRGYRVFFGCVCVSFLMYVVLTDFIFFFFLFPFSVRTERKPRDLVAAGQHW
jgi:hypothetical protein